MIDLYVDKPSWCNAGLLSMAIPWGRRILRVSKWVGSFVSGAHTWKTPQQHRAVVDVPSVCRHIRCGTDRPWVVAWKCVVSSPVSIEQPANCSTEMVLRQRHSAGWAWLGLWELPVGPMRRWRSEAEATGTQEFREVARSSAVKTLPHQHYSLEHYSLHNEL